MDNEFNNIDIPSVEEFVQKKRSSGRLMESVKNKQEAEKAALRKIKQKAGVVGPLNEDANPPMKEFVSQVKNDANREGEPSDLLWQPVSIDQIMSLYPQQTAISDVNTVISAANQQPGVSLPLVGPGDKRGEMFVKADKSGGFLLAHGDKNPKVFTNPGLNSDGDNDWDDKGKTAVPITSSFERPQINQTDLRHIVSCMAEDIRSLKAEVKSLKETKVSQIAEEEVDEALNNYLTEKKMSIQQQMEGMDDRSKAMIKKLLGAASDLRSGKASILDSADTRPIEDDVPVATNILTEEAPITIPSVKIDNSKLHEMLVKTTKKLSTKKTTALESLADSISDLIAENLLTNEISSSKILAETMETYKKLVG